MPEQDLPSLTEHGLLPEGIHRLSLEQVEALFGRFQKSERRCRLFAKLKTYLEDCKLAGWIVAVIVDGSFVMQCVDEPGDIDLIVLLPSEWDFTVELPPFAYNLVATSMARKLHGMDAFAVAAGSAEEAEYLGFFSEVNAKWNKPPVSLPTGIRKGLARIDL